MGQTFDASTLTLKIISCIYRAEEKYGAYVIASILCGKLNKKVQTLGLEKLSTFDIVKDLSTQQLIAVIHYLMYLNLIFRSTEHNNLKLTIAGKQFLKNKPTLVIPQKIVDDVRTPLFAQKLLPTHLETFALWQQSKTIAEIAAQRNFKETTIEGHITDLIYHQKIENIYNFVDNDTEQLIRAVLKKNPIKRLKDIKLLLPENISYGQIKIVLASQPREKFES